MKRDDQPPFVFPIARIDILNFLSGRQTFLIGSPSKEKSAMICPNCNAEYTASNPCACSHLEAKPAGERRPGKHTEEAAADHQQPHMAPPGLSNPFWQ